MNTYEVWMTVLTFGLFLIALLSYTPLLYRQEKIKRLPVIELWTV